MTILVKKRSHAVDEADFLPHTLRMAELAAQKKAKNIKAYDVRGLTLVADSFLICTATSEPQMKGITNSIKEGMREIGVTPLSTEGAHTAGWVLLDFSNVIVHIFREEARDFYDLDGMWGDAKAIALDLDE